MFKCLTDTRRILHRAELLTCCLLSWLLFTYATSKIFNQLQMIFSLPHPCRKSVGRLPKSFASLAPAGCCWFSKSCCRAAFMAAEQNEFLLILALQWAANPRQRQGWVPAVIWVLADSPQELLSLHWTAGLNTRATGSPLKLAGVSQRLFKVWSSHKEALSTSSKPPGRSAFCREILRGLLFLNSLSFW